MTGPEFWLWFIAAISVGTIGIRFFIAAWRDHEDEVDRHIGSYRWPIDDDVDR